jgi:hypothetical protein
MTITASSGMMTPCMAPLRAWPGGKRSSGQLRKTGTGRAGSGSRQPVGAMGHGCRARPAAAARTLCGLRSRRDAGSGAQPKALHSPVPHVPLLLSRDTFDLVTAPSDRGPASDVHVCASHAGTEDDQGGRAAAIVCRDSSVASTIFQILVGILSPGGHTTAHLLHHPSLWLGQVLQLAAHVGMALM